VHEARQDKATTGEWDGVGAWEGEVLSDATDVATLTGAARVRHEAVTVLSHDWTEATATNHREIVFAATELLEIITLKHLTGLRAAQHLWVDETAWEARAGPWNVVWHWETGKIIPDAKHDLPEAQGEDRRRQRCNR